MSIFKTVNAFFVKCKENLFSHPPFFRYVEVFSMTV